MHLTPVGLLPFENCSRLISVAAKSSFPFFTALGFITAYNPKTSITADTNRNPVRSFI